MHNFVQRTECDKQYLLSCGPEQPVKCKRVWRDAGDFSTVYFQTALSRALYEQRVCFPPARILLPFKGLILKGGRKEFIERQHKRKWGWVGKGNSSTLKTSLQSPGNQQIKFQSLTRSCKKYREEERQCGMGVCVIGTCVCACAWIHLCVHTQGQGPNQPCFPPHCLSQPNFPSLIKKNRLLLHCNNIKKKTDTFYVSDWMKQPWSIPGMLIRTLHSTIFQTLNDRTPVSSVIMHVIATRVIHMFALNLSATDCSSSELHRPYFHK